MRIALVSPGFPEYAAELARALGESHDVLFVLERGQFTAELGISPEELDWPERVELLVVEHAAKVATSLANAARVGASVRRFRPDVIHVQEALRDYLFLAMQSLRGAAPLVVTVHDPLPHSGTDSVRMGQRYGRYLKYYRAKADRAVVHGAALRSDLGQDTPRLVGQIDVVPHGVLGLIAAPPPSALPDTQHRVLLFGRMEAYKGVADFVEIVQRCPVPGVVGVLAGRGPALDALIPTLDPGRFEVHNGYVGRSEVIRLFDSARVVLLPYRDATQSGVALLAVGRRRPVIASRVGGLAEVVIPGQNGVLIPPCEPQVGADELARVLTDSQACRDMSEEAALLAEGQLSWRHVAALTTAVYLKAQGRP